MGYQSLEDIVGICEQRSFCFPEAIIASDMEEQSYSKEESMQKMKGMWKAMLDASNVYDGNLHSKSGLVGGTGAKMEAYQKKGDSLCGDFISKVITQALQMGESNACMKRIVAAPTAGACGVLPAVLVTYYKEHGVSEEEMLYALFTAAGIGAVIATRAFIAGAAGGCQAEIGSASAMAAGAITYLKGGDNKQIIHSAAMALKNLLGLVCDPVAGLVEVPCVKRNVVGAVNALSSADMALAGIESRIPPDQVIDAMRQIGESMDVKLRETGEGGVAASEEGQKIAKKLREE